MTLRDVSFPPKDEPLRRDVGLLGDIVGRVIREQGGEELFRRVERARHAAIRRREGASDATHEVEQALAGLDAEQAEEVVRAYSMYFQVVNLAERVHRIRRGRAWMREGEEPQPGSLADTVERLRKRGLDQERMRSLFSSARVEPVFTAHPTESTRRIILEKQDRIAAELIGRLNPERTPREEAVATATIRENVTAAWQTEEHPSARPTVADEREHVLYYVTRTLYRVLPALHETLDEALEHPEQTSTGDLPPLIRPGSWVGGDMDGNPNVDANTVRETLRRHRDLTLEAYEREVGELARNLTQSASRVSWNREISVLGDRYGGWFPETDRAIPERHRSMGYRVLLELIGARLAATRADSEHGYAGPEELLDDINAIAKSLVEHDGTHAGLFGVRRLLRRIRTFGFHMAALDVRQDARALREVAAELFDDPAWPERPSEERIERLHEALSSMEQGDARTGREGLSDAALDTLDVFRAISEGRGAYGADAIGSYIISMAEDVDDVLTVAWLATLGGLGTTDDLPLDIAPLFETVSDLERAEEVLEALFTDPFLGPHVSRRGSRQIVMVGYSDSNKDGGIASARWALQRALEGMARAATRQDVTLTVFHGRGGTVSRGGGSVHRAVAAMPAGSIGGRLRLTEQGEVIDAKYGLPQIALRNLERMLGSIVLRAADRGEDEAPPRWRSLADTVAGAARTAYRSLVYEDPRFTAYFRSGTPIDVIERMSIGSRPPSRRSGAGVEDLRAIPWVFSWTQCRAMMTGWYGLGTGLEAARAEHGLGLLQEAAEGWPFFDTLLADVEMVLAKADLEIAGMYRALAPAQAHAVYDRIRDEFDRTVSAVLEIRQSSALLDDDPTLQRSIRLRNPYVDPMNMLQVDLLRRWRHDERPDGALLDALLATVNGIARGLQNTG
ncbi:MAG: phosphoenolpyruvate carboxylase [Gemmatimonadota bacterium]|nr:phosphoenolpyruvate carboxylase [Gemmatimonadota bacterium]